MHLPIQCDREYRMLLGIETIYLQHTKMGGEHVLMGLLFAWNRYSTCQTPSLSLSLSLSPTKKGPGLGLAGHCMISRKLQGATFGSLTPSDVKPSQFNTFLIIVCMKEGCSPATTALKKSVYLLPV